MRLLQAARLSRLGDASTGIEKQDEQAKAYATVSGHEIVGTAADTDVSGSTDPFKRPQLGPWLTDPDRIGQYDGIIASHVDRLARSTIYFIRLLEWADANGKTIITTGQNGIDFSTPVGKLLGYIISWLGEQELAAITKRSRETQTWLKDNGFLVGTIPYGYMAVVKGDSKHKTLAPDPEAAPFVVAMFERSLAGESLAQICAWLDAAGAKPAAWKEWDKQNHAERGPEPIWNPATVSGILRNPVVAGRRTGANGRTVLKGFEPIIDGALFRAVNAKLDANPRKRGTASGDTALLTGILLCGKCNGPMYRVKVPRRKGVAQVFYRCTGTARNPSKCKNMIPLAQMDAEVGSRMLAWKDEPYRTTRLVPGSNHEAELAEVRQEMRELAAQDDMADDAYDAALAALRAERDRLLTLPATPDRTELVDTGETLGEHWQARDVAGRREMLLEGKVRIHARKTDNGSISAVAYGGNITADWLDKAVAELRSLPPLPGGGA